MPLTAFFCPECRKEFSRFRTLSQIPAGTPCPACGKPAAALRAGQAAAQPLPNPDDGLPEIT